VHQEKNKPSDQEGSGRKGGIYIDHKPLASNRACDVPHEPAIRRPNSMTAPINSKE
jgi:hypothetical protein